MEKPFDAVEWMPRRREEIDAEDESLTWAERREKTRAVVEGDPLFQRLCPAKPLPGKDACGQEVATP